LGPLKNFRGIKLFLSMPKYLLLFALMLSGSALFSKKISKERMVQQISGNYTTTCQGRDIVRRVTVIYTWDEINNKISITFIHYPSFLSL
ncbi:MAG: hypothetical protein WCF67_13615, partial [Chitinophagaceae bacterium]